MWLYHRFGLSFRDVEDVLARRGVIVTDEAIRPWCRRFGPDDARGLRHRPDRATPVIGSNGTCGARGMKPATSSPSCAGNPVSLG